MRWWFVFVAAGCAAGGPARDPDGDRVGDPRPWEGGDDSDPERPLEPGPEDQDGDGSDDPDDCAPWNPEVGPGAAEHPCNGFDDDCDGDIDEGRDAQGFGDADGDGWGDPFHAGACGAIDDPLVPRSGDCDDGHAGVHPGAAEVCNGRDDDCDGDADEDAPDALTWRRDLDGDGFGAGEGLVACSRPSWAHVADASDCDDGEAGVHPGATGWCNGRDDDCDGLVDGDDADEAEPATWRLDADGDGFGTSVTLTACEPGPGWADEAGDCDDADASVFPGAPEACADGRDTDCDGVSACSVDDADAFVHGTNGRIGPGILPLGDADGDGFDEVVLGTSDGAGCPAGWGALYLLEAPLAGRIDAWDADATIEGERNADCVGYWAAVVGDLDGDGVPDLVVAGEDHADPRGTSENPMWAVWATSGAARGEVTLGDAFAKVSAGLRSPVDLAGGDVDGDGYADLVVGDAEDRQGGDRTGSTSVFAGPLSGRLDPADARTRIFHERVEEGSPRAGVEAGDVDGDGTDELMLLGQRDGWLLSDVPSGSLLRPEAAVASFPEIGSARLLDADGDGRAEVFVLRFGNGLEAHAGPLEGEIGSDGAMGTYRWALDASAGDPDGDGDLELLLHGRAELAGDYENVAWLLDDPSGVHDLEPGDAALRWTDAGQAAFAGDLDGDGHDDVVLTSAYGADPYSWAGAAWMISGAGL